MSELYDLDSFFADELFGQIVKERDHEIKMQQERRDHVIRMAENRRETIVQLVMRED